MAGISQEVSTLNDISTGAWSSGVITNAAKSPKSKDNKKDVEIIGIKDAILNHLAYKPADSIPDPSSILTQTTDFYTTDDWYTMRADSARIKLTNSTGETTRITSCHIRAKLVYRYSGDKGYIHDSFVDYDDIVRNGERLFKLQNNMICNVTQVNQLADYWWKVHKNKKHVYQITLPGTRHWYKPGAWYTLQIGAAGEAEYIDSTVRLVGKSVEQSPTSLGKTKLTFLEVEENWKFDSSEVARYIASGVPLRGLTGGNIITVASSTYDGLADVYCDGTADQTEIQAAIDALVNGYGGGTVHLTRGQFNITAAIELDSNIVLEGEGAQTVIEKNCNDYAIECIGSSGSEKENVYISNLKVTRDSADTNATIFIRSTYTANFVLINLILYDCYAAGVSVSYSSGMIHGCIIDFNNSTASVGSTYYGISIGGGGNEGTFIVQNTVVKNVSTSITYFYGISAGSGKMILSNNEVYNIYSDGTIVEGVYCYANKSLVIGNKIHDIFGAVRGIDVSANNCSIDGNIVYDVTSPGANAAAITVTSGTNNKICNNEVHDNGNEINYGDCEDNSNPPQTDGNLATNTSAARDGTEAYEGDYSYKITKSNAAGTGASYWFVDNNTSTDMHGTVIKQGSYRLGLWVYIPSTGGPAAAEVNICISEYDGGWNDTTDTATTQDAWEYLEAEVTLDSDTTGFRCGVEFADTAAQNEYIYIDNVRLTPMGVANEHNNNFYDGGTDTIIG